MFEQEIDTCQTLNYQDFKLFPKSKFVPLQFVFLFVSFCPGLAELFLKFTFLHSSGAALKRQKVCGSFQDTVLCTGPPSPPSRPCSSPTQEQAPPPQTSRHLL